MRDTDGLIGRFVSILMLGLVVAFVIVGIAYAQPASHSQTSAFSDAVHHHGSRPASTPCVQSDVRQSTAPSAPAA